MRERTGADPDFQAPQPKLEPRRGFRLIDLLVTVAIFGVLVALLLPATRSSRGAARRAQCVNNLKQIAIALRNYEMTYGALPPARTTDAGGRPLHSWRTLILPFMDQESLYRRIDLAKPWNHEANAAVAAAMPQAFRCPGADTPPNTTTYLAVVGPSAGFLPDRPRRLAEVTGDHAATIMVIEAGPDSATHWMAPTDAGESLLRTMRPATRLDHAGGTHAALLDGSVRFLRPGEPLLPGPPDPPPGGRASGEP